MVFTVLGRFRAKTLRGENAPHTLYIRSLGAAKPAPKPVGTQEKLFESIFRLMQAVSLPEPRWVMGKKCPVRHLTKAGQATAIDFSKLNVDATEFVERRKIILHAGAPGAIVQEGGKLTPFGFGGGKRMKTHTIILNSKKMKKQTDAQFARVKTLLQNGFKSMKAFCAKKT